MLHASHLVMRYGAVEAVRDVSFTVNAGEVVALLGPNGAGKSSTLSMVSGMVPPTAGTVFLDGAPLTRDNLLARRRIGYVPDQPRVFAHLTAREYVRYVAGLYGIPARAADRAAAPLFARFRLDGQEDVLLGAYSHGMRQKALLVATLAHDPGLLILDEPIVGLDPVSAHILRDVIRERARAGTAVLFSTHLLDIATAVADRLVVLHAGTVRADGTLPALRALVGADEHTPLEQVFFALIGESLTDTAPSREAA